MSLKQYAMAAILSLAAVFGGYAQESVQKEGQRDAFTQSVEREIKKHDSWVEGYIEKDYTNKDREGVVTIRKARSGSDKFTRLSANGRYNPETNTLSLPQEKPEEAFDAFDHEISHAAYDEIVGKPGYEGPGLEEISKYFGDKVSGQEFNDLKKKISDGKEIIGANAAMLQGYDTLKKKIETSQSAVETISDSVKYMTKGEYDKIVSLQTKRDEELRSFDSALADLKSYLGTDGKDADRIKMIGKLYDCVCKVKTAHNSLDDFLITATQVAYAAEDRYFDASLKKLNDAISKEEDDETKESLKELAKDLEEQRSLTAYVRENNMMGSPVFLKFINGFMDGIDEVASGLRSYKMGEMLGDPNEVMARTVDSLYSLYYGPIDQNKFPLTEQDLQFLRRFTYKGKPMFGKGIERYILGRTMISNGISSEKVKAQLEYATMFEYEGKKYSWPAASIEIQGTIPLEDEEKEKRSAGGNDSLNVKPLSEKDLSYLRMFPYEGDPIFKEAALKRGLRVAMIANGGSPDAVDRMLKDATVVESGDRMYLVREGEKPKGDESGVEKK